MARQENSGRPGFRERTAGPAALPTVSMPAPLAETGLLRAAPPGSGTRTLASLFRDTSSNLVLDTVQTALLRPGILSPIIFAGPSGTGKTHLIQGVEREATDQGMRAVSVNLAAPWTPPATTDPDTGLADVFLADGIHHLPALPEEARDRFFAIFDAHFEGRRQIFLSSEIDPREIPVPGRWHSRLLAGLVLDLRLPDDQDRLTFLTCKLADFDMEISSDRLAALSLPEGLSYRDLESVAAMVFLYTRNGWNDTRLNEALRNRFHQQNQLHGGKVPIDDILAAVLKRFSVQRSDVLGKSRRAEHTLPRHIAMVLSLRYSGLNKSSIARYFQRSDHSIVIHAQKKMEQALQSDAGLRNTLRRIARDLGVRPPVEKK